MNLTASSWTSLIKSEIWLTKIYISKCQNEIDSEPRSKTESEHQKWRHSRWQNCRPMSRSKFFFGFICGQRTRFSSNVQFRNEGQAVMFGHPVMAECCQNMTCPTAPHLSEVVLVDRKAGFLQKGRRPVEGKT